MLGLTPEYHLEAHTHHPVPIPLLPVLQIDADFIDAVDIKLISGLS